MTQIFDTPEVDVKHNKLLSEEFALNLEAIFLSIQSRLGETNEMGQRGKIIGLSGITVLVFQLYNYTDRKFIKSLWDLHKKVSYWTIISESFLFSSFLM